MNDSLPGAVVAPPAVPDLATALQAMDVLNRWVRKDGCARPRKAIYWLKSNYAIRDAIMAGFLSRFRFVQWTGKCNRCRDGVYIDWDGHERGLCRHCNGSSRVTLKFVETTLTPTSTSIAGPFTWHSPLEYSSWHGWPMDDVPAVDAGDWSPNRDGIELLLEDAAALLNIVETRWAGPILKHQPHSYARDEWDDTRWAYFAYQLALPDPVGPRQCAVCGVPEHKELPLMLHALSRRPGLTWSHPVCPACRATFGDTIWKRLEQVPLPEFGPEMTRWIARHEAFWGLNFRDENRRRIGIP